MDLKFKFSRVQLFGGMVVLRLGVARSVQRTMVFLKSMKRAFDLSGSVAATDFCKLEKLLPPVLPLHCAGNYLWGHKTLAVGVQLIGWISQTALTWCIDTNEGVSWRHEWGVRVRLCLDQQWHQGKKCRGIISTKALRGKTNISFCVACGVFKGHQDAAWMETTPK